jgi:hypothetical protein
LEGAVVRRASRQNRAEIQIVRQNDEPILGGEFEQFAIGGIGFAQVAAGRIYDAPLSAPTNA